MKIKIISAFVDVRLK